MPIHNPDRPEEEDKDAMRCQRVTSVCNELLRVQMDCCKGKCNLARCREAHRKYYELEGK